MVYMTWYVEFKVVIRNIGLRGIIEKNESPAKKIWIEPYLHTVPDNTGPDRTVPDKNTIFWPKYRTGQI